MSDAYFDSRWNYMKRDTTSGSVVMAGPTTIPYAYQYESSATVTHNMGYVPMFSLFYEPHGDGIMYPAYGSHNIGAAYNPNNPSVFGPYLVGYATDTTLVLTLGCSEIRSGNYTIYYILYKDYGITD